MHGSEYFVYFYCYLLRLVQVFAEYFYGDRPFDTRSGFFHIVRDRLGKVEVILHFIYQLQLAQLAFPLFFRIDIYMKFNIVEPRCIRTVVGASGL